jgi:hypothetical protein|nr:MAG TPA: HNH endonuclease [Caudoviricetes sp.]DAS01864.1 MAG TPA: HNH endonuclease [Caudoviricetes sp.]
MPTINKPKPKRRNSKKIGLQAQIQRLVYNTSRWRKLVAAKKMMNPLCERCLARQEGERVKAVEEIHHIIPMSRAANELQILELGFDPSNLMSVCCQCHEDIHAEMRAKHKRKFTP